MNNKERGRIGVRLTSQRKVGVGVRPSQSCLCGAIDLFAELVSLPVHPPVSQLLLPRNPRPAGVILLSVTSSVSSSPGVGVPHMLPFLLILLLWWVSACTVGADLRTVTDTLPLKCFQGRPWRLRLWTLFCGYPFQKFSEKNLLQNCFKGRVLVGSLRALVCAVVLLPTPLPPCLVFLPLENRILALSFF